MFATLLSATLTLALSTELRPSSVQRPLRLNVVDSTQLGATDESHAMDRSRAPVLTVQLGHASVIMCAALSPDNRYVATGGFDKRAILWDLRAGRMLRILAGHTSSVDCLAVSPDGSRVVTGSRDKTAILWDAATGKLLHTLRHTEGVDSVVFCADGRALVTVADEGVCRIWNVATGALVRTLPGHGNRVFGLDVSRDGRLLATGSQDDTARILDLETGKTIHRLAGHEGDLYSVRFSRDGRLLATTSYDESIKIWNVRSGTLLKTLSGHRSQVHSADFSPDSKRLASAGWDRTIRVWDVVTGKQLFECDGEEDDLFKKVEFTSDGRELLVSGANPMLIDPAVARIRVLYARQATVPRAIAISSGESEIALACDHIVTLLDIASNREMLRYTAHSDTLEALAFSPDGTRAVSAGWDQTARVWDTRSGATVQTIHETGAIYAAVFSPDGAKIATSCEHNMCRVTDLSTGTTKKPLGGPAVFGASLGYSPKGSRVVGGNDEGTVFVWDATTGDLLSQFKGHERSISAIRFSRDGERFLTVGHDSSLGLWRTLDGRSDGRVFTPSPLLTTAAFSPTKSQIVAGAADGAVWKLDLTSPEIRHPLVGHVDRVNDLRFIANGEIIVTCSDDGTTRFWDAESNSEICSLVVFRNGGWAVTSPDGRFDSNNLDRVSGLHWMMPNEPFRPYPIELFMREYYEPRLLWRLLSREKLPSLPSLASLNRLQPLVEFKHVKLVGNANRIAEIEVTVRNSRDGVTGSAGKVSGARDLRIFRDGRLVATADGPLTFDADGTARFRFRNHDGLQVPGSVPGGKIEFSAYAFNSDMVKSNTATFSVDLPPRPRLGKVYAICVGLDRYSSIRLSSLQFAVRDAQEASRMFRASFGQSNGFREVIPIELTAPRVGRPSATWFNFKSVLDGLAGRPVSASAMKSVPALRRIEKATPDDVIIIFWSGHGISSDNGGFHLVAADTQWKEQKIEKGVGSEDLAVWLSDVDAREIALIIDACHSARAVEGAGFKPGPMGDRGFGQLAYDKGMMVLAATQANDVALEFGSLQHGLLTYALVEEGYRLGKAVSGGKLSLQGLLRFTERRIPEIYRSLKEGTKLQDSTMRSVKVQGSVQKTPPQLQRPALFDFLVSRRPVHLALAPNSRQIKRSHAEHASEMPIALPR